MTAIARKVQIGTAACAIAVAAALTPAAVAQADTFGGPGGSVVFFKNSGSTGNVSFVVVNVQIGSYGTFTL